MKPINRDLNLNAGLEIYVVVEVSSVLAGRAIVQGDCAFLEDANVDQR